MDLGSDGFVGTFPSSLLLEEYDFLTGAHKQSEELVGTFVWQAYVCVCLLNRISQPVCCVELSWFTNLLLSGLANVYLPTTLPRHLSVNN